MVHSSLAIEQARVSRGIEISWERQRDPRMRRASRGTNKSGSVLSQRIYIEIDKFSMGTSRCAALRCRIWRQKVVNRYQDSNENRMCNEYLKACVHFVDGENSRAKLFRGRPPDLIRCTIQKSYNPKAQNSIPCHLHPSGSRWHLTDLCCLHRYGCSFWRLPFLKKKSQRASRWISVSRAMLSWPSRRLPRPTLSVSSRGPTFVPSISPHLG